MANFSFSDYQNVVNAAQNKNNAARIGYFKLANDGDEALIRINCANVNDLLFASVHTISAAGKWLKVNCLNPLGTYNDGCELCTAAANGNSAISKAGKKVYIQMMVSYKDKTTGAWAEAIPVIWERPASFSREIANKLRDYGDLRQVLLKVTRNGVAGDMKTTYSMDYAVPTIFKPEMIPMDFSAFNNFNIAKHSYWEKTASEIHTFLTTGAFPEVITAAPAETQTMTAPVQPVNNIPVQNTIPVAEAPVVQAMPVTETPPARNFSGSKFSF